MGKPVWIDRERYDAMLEAFRIEPGVFRACARRAGVDRRTAQRAWERGWPDRGMKPIKVIIDDEQAAARAQLAEMREEEMRKLAKDHAGQVKQDHARAAEDAIVARAEEAQMVRASRHNAIGLMASVQRLLRGANQLAQKVESMIADAADDTEDGEGKKKKGISPAQATALFTSIAHMTRASNEAARVSQQMERSLLGEPEKWVGLHVNMSREEALREIEMGVKLRERLTAQGAIPTNGEDTTLPPEPSPAETAEVAPSSEPQLKTAAGA